MSEHTVKAFDAELKELTRKIGEMGELAEKQIGDSIGALTGHDVALGQGGHRLGDLPFGKAAHLRDHAAELLEIDIECLGGMFGHLLFLPARGRRRALSQNGR